MLSVFTLEIQDIISNFADGRNRIFNIRHYVSSYFWATHASAYLNHSTSGNIAHGQRPV